MKKLLKYWRENKQKILIAIGVIVFVWLCIRIANEVVKQQKENVTYSNSQSITAQDITKPNESVITDTKLNEEEVEENSKIIQDFVQYCNEKKVQEAYNLLSEDCKQELYANIDIFTNHYINQIFTSQKTYQLELWSTYNNCDTYRIKYIEGNILQTDGYNSNNNLMDYITIVKQDQELKLNINKFVMKEKINKIQTTEGIEITIDEKAVYIDYETYDITVKNNTDKTILLNDGKTASNFCLVDDMDVEYNSLIHEIPTNSLIIESKYNKMLNIKFSKMYNANNEIEYMQIKDIYLDKEQYDTVTNREEVQKTTITINL